MLAIDLRQTVCALAEALSLVGIDETQHAERVAYTALRCARQLRWSPEQQSDLLHAALLHDCGVSSSSVHHKLVSELDWDGSITHCLVGEKCLVDFPPLEHLAPVVRYHHTHWPELLETDIPQQERNAANLIYLADRVDALLTGMSEREGKSATAAVREKISSLAGDFFSPELIDSFLCVSDDDSFWRQLQSDALPAEIDRLPDPNPQTIDDENDLRTLAKIFANIVDAKSQFTYEHSIGVARLAVYLGERMELSPASLLQIEIAALLHDLGKLGVPDRILDKQERLTTEEWQIMQHHSFDSFRVLKKITGFEKIAEWAGNHHETLLGDGYPFHHKAAELDLETRIIIVADIFQALAQERPYRRSLAAPEIVSILREMAADNKIDATLVSLVSETPDLYWRLSRGGASDMFSPG